MKRGFALALVILASPGYAAPITFNTALPITRGEAIVRSQLIYREREAPGRDVKVSALALATGYGLTPRLALFAAVPALDKRLSLAGQNGSRVADGLGDLTVFARYTWRQWDEPGKTLRVAPLLGLIAPTGRDDQSDRAGRLPRPLQAGSGAWGALAGLVVTRQTLDWQVDAQLAVSAFGRDEGYQPGQRLALDLSGQYRVWPRVLGAGVPGFLYTVLELNLTDVAADELFRNKTASGGTQLLAAPGLQYVTRRWVLESALQLPVFHDVPTGALEDQLVARLSLRANF